MNQISHPNITIVDNQDRIIGTVPFSELHDKIARIGGVIVFCKDKILLQKRGPNVKMPNLWDVSAAGHVDENETYKATAKRELFEELGISATSSLNQLIYINDLVAVRKKFYTFFEYEWCGPIKFDPAEISETKWFTLDEVDKLVNTVPMATTIVFNHIWKKYLRSYFKKKIETINK